MKKAIATPTGVKTLYQELSTEELKQRQLEESMPLPVPALDDRLRKGFEEKLTPEQQADLSLLRLAVRTELDRGRKQIARLIIQRAAIPGELEPVRQALLEEFGNT